MTNSSKTASYKKNTAIQHAAVPIWVDINGHSVKKLDIIRNMALSNADILGVGSFYGIFLLVALWLYFGRRVSHEEGWSWQSCFLSHKRELLIALACTVIVFCSVPCGFRV